MRLKQYLEGASTQSDQQLRRKLKTLKADLKHMDVSSPPTQEITDAINDVHDQIGDIEAHLSRKVVHESAQYATTYASVHTQAMETVSRLQSIIDRHARRAMAAKHGGWGYVGDLNAAIEHLQHAIDILGDSGENSSTA